MTRITEGNGALLGDIKETLNSAVWERNNNNKKMLLSSKLKKKHRKNLTQVKGKKGTCNQCRLRKKKSQENIEII